MVLSVGRECSDVRKLHQSSKSATSLGKFNIACPLKINAINNSAVFTFIICKFYCMTRSQKWG